MYNSPALSTNTNSLDPEINTTPKEGFDNKAVLQALRVIQTGRDTKILRDNKNFLIQQLLEGGMDVKDPTGTRKINSKMLQQVFWRGANRMKPLSSEIFGTGRPKELREIVTAGVRTVMDRGGYTRSLRDKEGAYHKLLMWGDGFVYFGANPDPNASFPLMYSPVSNSNIYIDSYATGMRTGGLGRSVKKAVVIFSMSWADAVAYYPKIKKVATPGKIPRDTGFYKELERTYLQSNKLYDLIEIGYAYDIANRSYVCFAGPSCAVLEEYKGDNYPFTKGDNKDPYIPILQFICMPATEGFYNHGLGDMVYDLAILTQRLMNMAVGHIEENTYPVTLINVPKGEAAKFFNSLQAAQEMRAKGKKGVVPVEYDPGNPNSGRVSAESLLTQNMLAEWAQIYDRLDKEIARLGINLDDLDYGSDLTASQVMAQDQNSNSLFQQIGEYNASEYQFAEEAAMDMIVKLVSSKDKTMLNLTTLVKTKDGKDIPTDQITLGAIRDELKKHEYFVVVDSRSGVIPSNLMENVQVNNLLAKTPPGSPAWGKLMENFAQLNNKDLGIDDFVPQQQAPQGGSGAVPGGVGTNLPPPTETDRVAITPTSAKNPVPAL